MTGQLNGKTREKWFVLTFLILQGCSRSPVPVLTSSVEVPRTWTRDSGIASQPDGTVETLGSWWSQLEDPVLSGLIERALSVNTEIRQAEARLCESRARLGLSRSDLGPAGNLSLSAARARAGESGTANNFYAGLDASWEIDLFGGKRKGIKAAEADLEAARATLEDVQASVASEVALAYVENRIARARLATAEESVRSQSETLELVRSKRAAGLTSELDVDQARTNLEFTRAQLSVHQLSMERSSNSLAVLAGVAPGTLDETLSLSSGLPKVPTALASRLPAETLRSRPDVRAAEQRLLAEVARREQSVAALCPSLRLNGTLGSESLDLQRLFDVRSVLATILAGLTAPVLDRGRLEQKIDIQDAVARRVLAEYEETILMALQEVENALSALKSARERKAAFEEAVTAARSAENLARHSYAAGLSDFQAVLESERSALSARDNLIGAQSDELRAVITLSKALGTKPQRSNG